MTSSQETETKLPAWILSAGCAIVALVSAIWLMMVKSDEATALLGGFSVTRLVMILFTLAAFVFFAYRVIHERSQPVAGNPYYKKAQVFLQNRITRMWMLVLSYILVGVLIYPTSQLEYFPNLIERSKPLLFLGCGLLVVGLLWDWVNRVEFSRRWMSQYLQDRKHQMITSAMILLLFVLLLAFMYVSRIGLMPDLYWKAAGIPVLSIQLYMIVGVLFLEWKASTWVKKRPFFQKSGYSTIILFILIWIAGALIWNLTPQERSVFAPGPYPPHYVLYPHSDAAVHDSGAEMVTIGLPLNNGEYTDKPAYMFFLGMLHLLLGDDLNMVTTAQVAVLALFPAILFLLGKEIYSQRLGVFIALITIARAGNAIQAVVQVFTVSVKELMSEVPLALVLCLLLLWLIRFVKNPTNPSLAAGIGGIYGLSILIRPHPILLIPFLLALFIFVLRKNWKLVIRQTLLFLLTLAIVLVPISADNIRRGRTPDYVWKISHVLFYRGEIQTQAEEETSPLILPTEPAIETTKVSSETPLQIVPTTPDVNNAQPMVTILPAEVLPVMQPTSADTTATIDNKLVQLASHLLHNEMTILLSLPMSPGFDNLAHTLEKPFWMEEPVWDGSLQTGQWIALMINLVILALGVGYFFDKNSWWGLMPLMVQLFMNGANTIARSSGGRFLVPVDWVIFLYYAIGLFEAARLLCSIIQTPPEESSVDAFPSQKKTISRAILGGLAVPILLSLTLGVGMVSIQSLSSSKPGQYSSFDQILQGHNAEQWIVTEIPQFSEMTQDPQLFIFAGKALYPRFYETGSGEPSRNSELSKQPYDRLTYQVIGEQGNYFVNMPLTNRGKRLEHGSLVILIGCRVDENTVDAQYLIIFSGERKSLLTRDQQVPLSCK